jgi:hypothetical protein
VYVAAAAGPAAAASLFNNFEKQLLTPGLGNYSAYVTPDSLVDFFLAAEVIKSANDGYRGSTYFWKDADSACAASELYHQQASGSVAAMCLAVG